MQYTNRQPTPVYSSDYEPLMPCHPARARKLLRNGRAVPHHIRGIFGIRLLDRQRDQCQVQDTSLNIDAGSAISGFAIVQDDNGQRTVLALVELRHRAKAIKSTMTGRSQHRRSRRGRLRHRAPRFNNRRREPGTLPPSVNSIRINAMRVVDTLCRIYPISSISIERYKFDTQLMQDPDIRGVEYQRGTLFGWQIRAYIFDRDQGRCVYCQRRNVRLELDHVRPRATGSDRVGNLVASCRDCNVKKANQPVEEFLDDQPDLLARILERLQRSDLASAAHVNAALPAIVRDLWTLGRPISSANAASVAWKRRQLNVPKSHCYDAALQGQSFDTIVSLPSQALVLRPNNGRAKQKANVNKDGTPDGKPFREQQRLPKHLRRHNPAPGHAGRRQRHGQQLISTGDTVTLEHHGRRHTGRAVIKSAGKRVAIHGTKPEISATISRCSRIARSPRWLIRRASPAQQSHQASKVK